MNLKVKLSLDVVFCLCWSYDPKTLLKLQKKELLVITSTMAQPNRWQRADLTGCGFTTALQKIMAFNFDVMRSCSYGTDYLYLLEISSL